MIKGAVLIVDLRGSQYQWTVAVGGVTVNEGISPSLENAQYDAVESATRSSLKR